MQWKVPLIPTATSVAVWFLVFPTQGQQITPVPIGDNNPTCQNAVVICNIPRLVHELEITDVKTSAGTKCTSGTCSRTDFDPVSGVTFEVSWQVVSATGAVNVADLTAAIFSQQADVPGFEAVIGEGRNGSNVYCGFNRTAVDGVVAPVINTPTKITFCWASGPCLQSPEEVEEACLAYENPNDPNRKNYLQAHRVAPQQPINVCGCSPEVAQFCDPSIPGSCPSGNISALATQGVATSGTATCQRVVIGGRSVFIGDTC